ncbi:sugar phosphate isomerase/epimerase [Solwaraspora sp. WMMD406]|uniref:sugar phosphate isomerase/epimerase family protein n=1 Tax=Solwaraspora sp. WMMD406 TaxID=3016095 RepID=UPI0024169D82|nr:sugar phosphate isomerase/epimerase family protein [Solwaraspora sp. WMMD406]MDG4765737.1 sugar phosphate isomerase/epimerase [Solwaraspora sp. WMMD406]
MLHSYALRDYPREHVFRVARLQGWPAVELAACHFDSADPGAELVRAVEQARQAGLAVECAGYWGMFADRDERVRRATIDRVRSIIDACAATGVPMINGSGGWLVHDAARWDEDWRRNGSAIATDDDYDRVAAAYQEVAEHAAGRGVRIGVEIHPNTVHDTAAATARLLRRVDRPGMTVTVDPSNAAALSVADREPGILGVLDDWPVYFHLKNCVVRGGVADFSVDAAGGEVDNHRWLRSLVDSGRCDAVSVEYCGTGDPHPRLLASRRYLDETLRLITAA